MYALLKDNKIEKYPYSIHDLRQDFPNTLFPKRIEDIGNLDSFGVVVINPAERPAYDESVEYLEIGTPELVDGVWTQKWDIVAFTSQQLEARENSAAAGARERRNILLTESDWTQLPDSPVDTASWGIYRQALRDISSQEGFPFNINWPEKPST